MNMLASLPYREQLALWPDSGRHILAHYDTETIVVYQAFSHTTGQHAVKHGSFGVGFKYNRMSWVKTNFLWMMHRSNWGQAHRQQVVLGIRLRRTFFDFLLEQAVLSEFSPELYGNRNAWETALAISDVRLQWDPDHLPTGQRCHRRAIQLGLRSETLASYAKQEIVEFVDMTEFIAVQRKHVDKWEEGDLLTPIETVYWPANNKAIAQVGLFQYQTINPNPQQRGVVP